MKSVLCASVMIATALAPAFAGAHYDRKLEKAAMEIVAGKIGDIRGGFSYQQKPRFVVVQDAFAPADAMQGPNASPSLVKPAARPNS